AKVEVRTGQRARNIDVDGHVTVIENGITINVNIERIGRGVEHCLGVSATIKRSQHRTVAISHASVLTAGSANEHTSDRTQIDRVAICPGLEVRDLVDVIDVSLRVSNRKVGEGIAARSTRQRIGASASDEDVITRTSIDSIATRTR